MTKLGKLVTTIAIALMIVTAIIGAGVVVRIMNTGEEFDEMMRYCHGNPRELQVWCMLHFQITNESSVVGGVTDLAEIASKDALTHWELAWFKWGVMTHYMNIRANVIVIGGDNWTFSGNTYIEGGGWWWQTYGDYGEVGELADVLDGWDRNWVWGQEWNGTNFADVKEFKRW